MERGIKGFVEKTQGEISTEEFIKLNVNLEKLKGQEDVETTFGTKKTIKTY